MQRPASNEHSEYYTRYTSRVPDGDICDILDRQQQEVQEFFSRYSDQRASAPLLPGKWTIKQILGHLSDGERIFGYRALRISRGDKTPLPGFDQDLFTAGTDFNAIPLSALLGEWQHLRAGNLLLFRYMTDQQSALVGTASDAPVTPRALAYIMAGHTIHHLAILRERYPQS